MSDRRASWIQGELLGTFLLVFFGCGSVATSVALGVNMGLFQVAIVWGLGLTVAIYLTGALSGAHLNPAITLAFVVCQGFPVKRALGYVVVQFAGAFLAAASVYALFGGAISAFELEKGLIRGNPGSEASAMIFGEYFPNPGAKPLTEAARQTVPHGTACFAEALGTALLALAIFGFTSRTNGGAPGPLTPVALGITLTTLICIFAPLTQAGFNPARDLAPRFFSFLVGWKDIPFTANGLGWLTVYVVSPCVGAVLGGLVGSRLRYS
ncbi:aquaporin [bacterium]|nr:aquaporin [bacterium]